MKKSIERSLADFLIGFVNSKNFETDKFLQRTVRDIIRIYIGRFNANTYHPLKTLLSVPIIEASPSKQESVKIIVITVISKLVTDLRLSNPSYLLSVLSFCSSCLKNPSEGTLKHFVDIFLPSLLDLVLLTDLKTLKNLASSLLIAVIKNKRERYQS